MEKQQFLESYKKYQLGVLPTESSNPDTVGLAELAKKDLQGAIALLKKVDRKALNQLLNYSERIESMRSPIQKVLDSGGRIFLCGCGATGRLSLLLEFLWREKYNTDQVVSFMAGGDVALVHSLEGFEDFPEYGRKHLIQMGFTKNDLLIATTEGGETPYVIGATEAAAELSNHQPYFLYCNPKDLLMASVDRSKRIIENPRVREISLFVGPMALSGSTRMQSSTVLQLAVGAALLETEVPVSDIFNELISELDNCDFSFLSDFIAAEAKIYFDKNYLMYTPSEFAITVFTDTTERSPTFSLPSFENNEYQGDFPSLCYIMIPDAKNSEQAWHQLLRREPHALEWAEIDEQTSEHYLETFDFSQTAMETRAQRIQGARQHQFKITLNQEKTLEMFLDGCSLSYDFQSSRSLVRHTLLKLILNNHSTLLMGLMGRFESNVMTWVKPTNAKLVDRSARYISQILQERGVTQDYLNIIHRIYDLQPSLGRTESIVQVVVKSFVEESP